MDLRTRFTQHGARAPALTARHKPLTPLIGSHSSRRFDRYPCEYRRLYAGEGARAGEATVSAT